MLKGISEFISIFLVLKEERGQIMPGQPLSSLFTTWWENSQYFTEMVPLVASPQAPVATLGHVGLGNLILEWKVL